MKAGKKKQLSSAAVFQIFSQLHELTGAGITPYAALGIMAGDADHGSLAELLKELADRISGGALLSEAVTEAGVFPPYVGELLYVGEQTGRIDEACGALGRYYEEEDALRESVRSAVSYPLMMIVVMFLVIVVLMNQVMPVFMQVFHQLGATAGGTMQAMLKLSGFFSRYYIVLAVLLALVLLAFLYCCFTENGRRLAGRLAGRFPLTRSLMEDLALVRFTSGLRMAYAAGLDPYRSLEIAERIVEYPPLEDKIELCRKRLYEGESFSGAMANSGIYRPFYTSMLTVFSEAGSMDRALEFIAAHYKEDTDRRIGRILSAIEPTMVIVIALIIGVILLSVIMPLIGIMSGIG